MNTTGLNLLISDKPDAERDALAEAFFRGGGKVYRLDRFWEPPIFDPATVRVYGADAFCLVLQQKLGFQLCSPEDDLLLRVPAEFLKRRIDRRALGDIASGVFPAFIKPVVPKQFRGAVYTSLTAILEECRGLPLDTRIFVSEPVKFAAEARSFVLESRLLDVSIYEGMADVSEANVFIATLIRSMPLPSTAVVDVGLISGRGWAVVEFNAAWGAGLNGCDPIKVLPGIVAASASKPNSAAARDPKR